MNQNSEKVVEIYDLVTLATLDTMLRCAFSYNGDIQTKRYCSKKDMSNVDFVYRFPLSLFVEGKVRLQIRKLTPIFESNLLTKYQRSSEVI